MSSWSREHASHLTRRCCALIRGQRNGMRGRITGANQREGCVGREERRKGKCRKERAQERSIADASARGAARIGSLATVIWPISRASDVGHVIFGSWLGPGSSAGVLTSLAKGESRFARGETTSRFKRCQVIARPYFQPHMYSLRSAAPTLVASSPLCYSACHLVGTYVFGSG